MSGRKTDVPKEIVEGVYDEIFNSIADAMNKANLDSIREMVLRATKTGENSGKGEKIGLTLIRVPEIVRDYIFNSEAPKI
jgi:hypothetical protein